jgi:archaellum component FlaF (FlaF/FlaG flagellin family)
MTALEIIKNNLIEKILATKNEQILETLNQMLDSSNENDFVTFTQDQIEILNLSETDISLGNLISEADLNKRDSKVLS